MKRSRPFQSSIPLPYADSRVLGNYHVLKLAVPPTHCMTVRSGTNDDMGAGNFSDYLQARFRIEPCSECRVIESGQEGSGVEQSLVDCGEEGPSKCLATVTGKDGQQHLVEESVEASCICPVFNEHDCIATIEIIDPPGFVVSIAARERDEFTSIVGALREADANPRLVQITQSSDPTEYQRLEFDMEDITDKQREAIRIAVEKGYYEKPRRATLGDLAEQLDISRSAVSQRLTAVESKMVYKLVETRA